jgi:hypothetical protein
MQTKHANAAGLGASVRLRPADSSHIATGLTKEETAGHLAGTTAASIENQHLDFAILNESAPETSHAIKAKLTHWGCWLAVVFKGVA